MLLQVLILQSSLSILHALLRHLLSLGRNLEERYVLSSSRVLAFAAYISFEYLLLLLEMKFLNYCCVMDDLDTTVVVQFLVTSVSKYCHVIKNCRAITH